MEYFYVDEFMPTLTLRRLNWKTMTKKWRPRQKKSSPDAVMEQFPQDDLRLVGGFAQQIQLVRDGQFGIFLSLRLDDMLQKLEDKKVDCYLLTCHQIISQKMKIMFNHTWVKSITSITTDPIYPYKVIEKNVLLSINQIDFSQIGEHIQRREGLVTKYDIVNGDVLYFVKIFLIKSVH